MTILMKIRRLNKSILVLTVVVLSLQGFHYDGLFAEPPFNFVQLDGMPLGNIRRVAWHPSNNQIAIAIDDHISIYDGSLQFVGSLEGHTDTVYGLAWSPWSSPG